MHVDSTRLGMLEVTQAQILVFPEGIAGFETVHQYCVIHHGHDSPFIWLQAISVPDLAFVVVDPLLLYPEYTIALEEADVAEIGVSGADEFGVFVIVTFSQAGMTVNLAAPILVNLRTHRAWQVVLSECDYSCRQRIGTPMCRITSCNETV